MALLLYVWKGKKIFVDTYGWIESFGEEKRVFKNIILFQADASLKEDKEEVIQIHNGILVMKKSEILPFAAV